MTLMTELREARRNESDGIAAWKREKLYENDRI